MSAPVKSPAQGAPRPTAQGAPRPTALTAAQARVLALLPTQLTCAEIGTRLAVSESTVKTHVRAVYRKLGVRRRTAAVERARSLGLLPAD